MARGGSWPTYGARADNAFARYSERIHRKLIPQGAYLTRDALRAVEATPVSNRVYLGLSTG